MNKPLDIPGRFNPQSNGTLERFQKTIKGDAIRPAGPSSLDEARTAVADFVDHSNILHADTERSHD